jgi:hypothetical protein
MIEDYSLKEAEERILGKDVTMFSNMTNYYRDHS